MRPSVYYIPEKILPFKRQILQNTIAGDLLKCCSDVVLAACIVLITQALKARLVITRETVAVKRLSDIFL